jgi:hypothetical protein
MRLFAEPLPVRLEWHEGELAALCVLNTRVVVAEVVRRWRVDGEWWNGGPARDYMTVRAADGTVCEVYRDRRSGQWFLQRVLD